MAEHAIHLSVEPRSLQSGNFDNQLDRPYPPYNILQRKVRLPERWEGFSGGTATALVRALLLLHAGCRFFLPNLNETALCAPRASINYTK